MFCCFWNRYCQWFARYGVPVSAGNRNSTAGILWKAVSAVDERPCERAWWCCGSIILLQLCSQPSLVEHSKHVQREWHNGYSGELWAGASLVIVYKETLSAAWSTADMWNRVQEKPSFLFSVLSHGEIVHSSAVEAPWPCIITIYVCAENKEAAEFFSQLSTLYNKRVQLSLGKVHKACQTQREAASK